MKILRFYGSCGHVEDEEISEERFSEYTKEIINKTVFGNFLHRNEVTKENGNDVVHVHPFRYFICNTCIKEELKDIENEFG